MMHITSKKGSIQLRALLAGTVDIVPFPAAASQSRARIRLLLATPTQRRTHTGTSLGSGSTPTSATVSVLHTPCYRIASAATDQSNTWWWTWNAGS